MVVVEINCVYYGSTGTIASSLAKMVSKKGGKGYLAVPLGRHNKKMDSENIIFFGNRFSEDSHIVLARLTGLEGHFSIFATLSLISKLKKLKPHVIHLHNLHSCYINLPILFEYLKTADIPVVWTLHDCWAFTGHCPHYDAVGCLKWQTGCFECSLYKQYPKSFFDNSQRMYEKKRKWFKNIKKMTLVTPSFWLADEVKKSFLSEFPVNVISNGVDLRDFYPRESNFKEKHNIKNKYVVLGVASVWLKTKGFDTFFELAKLLPSNYQIVLVGKIVDDSNLQMDKILYVDNITSQDELAQVYSSADVFVNPTVQEAFGLVNIEALACGTPVVTYRSGGSPECIDNKCGVIVEKNNINSMKKAIEDVCEKKLFSCNDCIERAKKFEINNQFQKYLNLYEVLANDGIAKD